MTDDLLRSLETRWWPTARRLAARLRAGRRQRAAVPATAESPLVSILSTPPIATDPVSDDGSSAVIGVHVLGQDCHVLPMLWTLKTFYHYAGVHYPLTVHLQGPHTHQMCAVLPQHFPHARLVSQKSANALVEPWLLERGFSNLHAMRRELFVMMKLIDLSILARTPLVVYFDTDVLFFRRPDHLITWPEDATTTPHLFMRDDHPSYCILPAQARADFDVNLIPGANAGLMRLRADAIDLAACERFLAHPGLARPHWHVEQTLHALYASAQGRLELLSHDYGMSERSLATPGLIARHYISPIRPLFEEEGVAHLLKGGFIDALAGRSPG